MSPIKKRGKLRYAGHSYYFNIASVKPNPNIWFKETLKLDKPEKSKVPRKVLEQFGGWFGKTVLIDVVCENSSGDLWKRYPDWMFLMFKLLASIPYKERTTYEEYMVMIPLDRLKRFGKVPENLFIHMLKTYLGFGLCIDEAAYKSEDSAGVWVAALRFFEVTFKGDSGRKKSRLRLCAQGYEDDLYRFDTRL